MHEDKFQAVQSDAGTGETAALEFVQEVARERGWDVRGIATWTTGARGLQYATGIKRQTVAAFLTERDEQIRRLQAELRQLEVDFAHASGIIPSVKRVAKRDLDMVDRGFAPGRYVFDSKSGEVLKATTDSWHPFNTFGVKLQDAGQARKSDAEYGMQKAERFVERLRERSRHTAGSIQETLGRSLTSYEMAATLEAKAARAEHREQGVEDRARLRSYLTKTAQIENLVATGNAGGKRSLLLMDESSMTGAKDSARITEIARDMGARVVLQGDIKQHASVAAGGAFLQAQEGGIDLSKIEETRRFDQATAQQRRAIAEMKQGRYAAALEALDVTLGRDVYGTAATRFVEIRRELLNGGIIEPKIGIVAITNEDRNEANKAVREALRKEGLITRPDYRKQHLDAPKLTQQQFQYLPALASEKVDHLTALREYQSLGIRRDELLIVVRYDLNPNRLTVQREDGQSVEVDPSRHTKFSFAGWRSVIMLWVTRSRRERTLALPGTLNGLRMARVESSLRLTSRGPEFDGRIARRRSSQTGSYVSLTTLIPKRPKRSRAWRTIEKSS